MATKLNQQLKPATSKAVEDALRVLIDSIEEENGGPKRREYFSSNIAYMDYQVQLYESAVRSCSAELLKMKRARNRHVPLHKLSVELFQDLLLEILPDLYSISWIRKHASISKSWHTAIVSFPRIWSSINSTNPPAVVPMFLRLSRGFKLDINLSGRDKLDAPTIAAFLEAVAPSAYRWNSLLYSGADLLPNTLIKALESPTPILAELILRPAKHRSNVPVSTFSLLGTTSLKRVSLHRISTDWTSPRLSNLVTLELVDTRDEAPPHQLHRILASSPLLESLTLSNWRSTTSTRQLPLTLPPLHFEHLRRLTAVNLAPAITHFLAISTYDAPLSSIQIDYIDITWPDFHLWSSIMNAYRAFLQENNSPLTTVRVNVSDSWSTFTILIPSLDRVPDHGASIVLSGPSNVGVFTAVESLVGSAPVALTGTFEIMIDVLRHAAHRMPFVTALDLAFVDGHGHHRTLEFLGTPLTGTAGWPFPHMDSLMLSGSWDGNEALEEFVPRRWGHCRKEEAPQSGPVEEEMKLTRPVKLKTFYTWPGNFWGFRHATGDCGCGF